MNFCPPALAFCQTETHNDETQYAGKDNEALETAIDQEIHAFLNLLEHKYISTDREFRPVDMARKVQYLTLDVITSLAFGQKFGYIDQDTDVHSYIQITEDSMPVMMVLSLFPVLAKTLQTKLFRWLMPSERDRVGFGAFIRYNIPCVVCHHSRQSNTLTRLT